MKLEFRALKAEEIEVKPQTVKENGFSLLLYKNARVDMDILDETVSPLNWQRKHSRENANCTVSIYDEDKKIWIEKEDTGTESFTEKEKGLASDSFKRACFNWGIGRELYTAPFIWINDSKYIRKNKEGKLTIVDKFYVKNISVKNKIITSLEIIDSKGNIVFTLKVNKSSKEDKKEDKKEKAIKMIMSNLTDDENNFIVNLLEIYKRNCLKDCTEIELKEIYNKLKARRSN